MKIKVFFLGLTQKMWPKVSLFALLAVITALMAVFLRQYIPDSISYKVDAETVTRILNIFATSMLAVTTFSLTVMVTAFNSVRSNVTPRAAKLLMQDRTTQNALATFLGSFLFSLVGIIGLQTGIYQGNGRLILFIVTLLLIMLILIMMIRWIERLTRLGSMEETTSQVENVTMASLKSRAEKPYLNAQPLTVIPKYVIDEGDILFSKQCGYVQFLDIEKLNEVAKKYHIHVYIIAIPGQFVSTHTALARLTEKLPLKVHELLLDAFIINEQRSFEQDPRFGLCVLAEIGTRALSPAINDTGTVIDIIGRYVRILSNYADMLKLEHKVIYTNIWVPELSIVDLFDDAFGALARESRELFEVQVRLQKAFRDLHYSDNESFRELARKHSILAMKRVEQSQLLGEEKARLKTLCLSIQELN